MAMQLTSKPLKEQWKQLAALALLLPAMGYVLYFQVFAPADSAGAASNPAASAAGTPVGAGGPLTLPSALKFDALEPVNDKPAPGRNPFRFGAPPPPPAPPVRQAPPPPPPQPVVQQPVGPPPVPPPPPITLKFVAFVQLPTGKKVASLSDGKSVLLGSEGDVIDGRYRIVRIGVESIVMEYLDGRGRQTIPLRGSGL